MPEQSIEDLTPDPRNANRGTERGAAMLESSLREFGAGRSILVDKHGVVIAGNKTLEQAAALGFEIQTVVTDGSKLVVVQRSDIEIDSPKGRRLAVADNRIGQVSLEWDSDVLAEMLNRDKASLDGLFDDEELAAALDRIGVDSSGSGMAGIQSNQTLAERFGVPPFSVLDARQGYWQDRKRAWLALGIASELGRGDALVAGGTSVDAGSSDWAGNRSGDRLTWVAGNRDEKSLDATSRKNLSAGRRPNAAPGGSLRPAMTLGDDGKTVRGDGKGRASGLARTFGQDLMHGEHSAGRNYGARAPHGPTVTQNPDGTQAYRPTNNGEGVSGTSVFDPVLCELAYRWFCPPEGMILDPFAGGSVRGIVASKLGRHYVGIDLRQEQIEANVVQGAAITPDNEPVWVVGDSQDADTIAPGQYDFVFTCPPYADLERYSDDPRDISTMDYAAFMDAYRVIVAKSIAMLKPDCFACVVVGDIRDKRGIYRNFVSDTIGAFQDAGALFYNEAILVTAVGSLSIRVGKQFTASRKLGKTHQNVLVFIKGDPKKATEAIGIVEFGEGEDPINNDPASAYGEVLSVT